MPGETFALSAPAAQPSREQREVYDAFDTPEPLARAICVELARLFTVPKLILEPSAGTGVFSRALQAQWPSATVHSLDIEPRGPNVERGDFITHRIGSGYDLVCGNPPWSLATEFVLRSLQLVPTGGLVVYLLRTTFRFGQERVRLLHRANPCRFLLPLEQRPSYTADGKSDSADSEVFIWQRGFAGRTEVLPHLSWRGGGR